MCPKTHHITWRCADPSMTRSHRRTVKGQGDVSSPGLVGDSPAPPKKSTTINSNDNGKDYNKEEKTVIKGATKEGK